MSTKLYEVPQSEELCVSFEESILSVTPQDNGNAKAPNGVSGGYFGDEF